MLRAFRVDRTTMPYRYQLMEIPTAIFESLGEAPLSAFDADGPTIDCAYGGNPAAARVSLDRSDAKITVRAGWRSCRRRTPRRRWPLRPG